MSGDAGGGGAMLRAPPEPAMRPNRQVSLAHGAAVCGTDCDPSFRYVLRGLWLSRGDDGAWGFQAEYTSASLKRREDTWSWYMALAGRALSQTGRVDLHFGSAIGVQQLIDLPTRCPGRTDLGMLAWQPSLGLAYWATPGVAVGVTGSCFIPLFLFGYSGCSGGDSSNQTEPDPELGTWALIQPAVVLEVSWGVGQTKKRR